MLKLNGKIWRLFVIKNNNYFDYVECIFVDFIVNI